MNKVIFIAVLFFPQISYALSDFGHELICHVAYELSTPETKRFIDEIILKGKGVQTTNFAQYKERIDLGDFARGCTWPDDIRKTSHRETDQYHFMNVPKGERFNHKRDCSRFDCVTQAIQRYGLELNDEKVRPTNRKEALFFLGHFVADIHQPLHVGYKEDKGGSNIKIYPFQSSDKMITLHWLWDKYIPQYAELDSPQAHEKLLKSIRSDSKKEWLVTNPVVWAIESHQLAKDYVYVLPNGNNVIKKQVIPNNYYQRGKFVISKRFKQAIVRLTYMLDLAAKGQLTPDKFD